MTDMKVIEVNVTSEERSKVIRAALSGKVVRAKMTAGQRRAVQGVKKRTVGQPQMKARKAG